MEPLFIYKAIVTKVSDGDTVRLMTDLGFHVWHNTLVRIRNFDAPEIKKYEGVNEEQVRHGLMAKAYATTLLLNQTVIVRTYKADPSAYARWEADIQLPDGRDFVQAMIDAGFSKKENYA